MSRQKVFNGSTDDNQHSTDDVVDTSSPQHIQYNRLTLHTLNNGPNQENENGRQDVAKEASGPKECQEEQGASQQGSRICGNEQGVKGNWIDVSMRTAIWDERLRTVELDISVG